MDATRLMKVSKPKNFRRLRPGIIFLGLGSLILAFIAAFMWAMTSISSEYTFLTASHVSMTGDDLVHLLIKRQRKKYVFGTTRTAERSHYLLDYSINTKAIKLYDVNVDSSESRAHLAIDNAHRLIKEVNSTNQETQVSQPECYYVTLVLSQAAYRWTDPTVCGERESRTGLNSLPYTDISGNMHRNRPPRMIQSSQGKKENEKIVFNRFNKQLQLQKPSTDGGYYKVYDENAELLAEQKILTRRELENIILLGLPFSYAKKNTLPQMAFDKKSKLLGSLPNGDLLLAFDISWAAISSIVLISWNLSENTTQLEGRIFYEDLFSASRFTLRHMELWDKLKAFPFPKRHPLVEVHQIENKPQHI